MELWEDSVPYLTLATPAEGQNRIPARDSRPMILTTTQPASSGNLSLPKTLDVLRLLSFRQAQEPLGVPHIDIQINLKNQCSLVQGESIPETRWMASRFSRHTVKTL